MGDVAAVTRWLLILALAWFFHAYPLDGRAGYAPVVTIAASTLRGPAGWVECAKASVKFDVDNRGLLYAGPCFWMAS